MWRVNQVLRFGLLGLIFSSVNPAVGSAQDGSSCVNTYVKQPQGEVTAQSITDIYIGATNLCQKQIIAIICVQQASDAQWVNYFGEQIRIDPGSTWADALLFPERYANVEALGCFENVACMNKLHSCR